MVDTTTRLDFEISGCQQSDYMIIWLEIRTGRVAAGWLVCGVGCGGMRVHVCRECAVQDTGPPLTSPPTHTPLLSSHWADACTDVGMRDSHWPDQLGWVGGFGVILATPIRAQPLQFPLKAGGCVHVCGERRRVCEVRRSQAEAKLKLGWMSEPVFSSVKC